VDLRLGEALARLHLATIWLAATGSNISAFFILAANSWMQHPVGFHINPATHRAELTSIMAVLTNSTVLAGLPHVILAGFMTAALFLIAVSAWHLARRNEVDLFRRAMRLGLVVALAAGSGTAVTGDVQVRLMDSQQPMKMAAAEALYDTASPASFSLFTVGSLNGSKEVCLRVPNLLSLIATLDPNGTVRGINNLERACCLPRRRTSRSARWARNSTPAWRWSRQQAAPATSWRPSRLPPGSAASVRLGPVRARAPTARSRPGPRAATRADLHSIPITLNAVCLTYHHRDAPALDGVSLEISPGERITVTGPSGAGKSSLFALLLRFVEPTSGTIEAAEPGWPRSTWTPGGGRSPGCRSAHTCSPEPWPPTSPLASPMPAPRR
jgi:cytochrome bd-type quinol oxidase subunit 1